MPALALAVGDPPLCTNLQAVPKHASTDGTVFSLIVQFPEAAPHWRDRPDRRVAYSIAFRSRVLTRSWRGHRCSRTRTHKPSTGLLGETRCWCEVTLRRPVTVDGPTAGRPIRVDPTRFPAGVFDQRRVAPEHGTRADVRFDRSVHTRDVVAMPGGHNGVTRRRP